MPFIMMPVLKYSTTLSKQSSLPRLPVPSLDSTLSKYLKAVKHLVNEIDYEKTLKLANEFSKSGGLGEKLQRFLVERSKTTENWVSLRYF